MLTYAFALPQGFVYLRDVDPSIIQSVRYFGDENFIGRPLNGYKAARIILTEPAATALRQAQKLFNTEGYTIVIYDGYRPQRAVDDIKKWSKDQNNAIKKELYYPRVDKDKFFELGYVLEKSGHTRGSTIDISIMQLENSLHKIQIKQRKLGDRSLIQFLDDGTVDMGSSFDLFDEASHSDSELVNDKYKQKRNFLKSIMEQCSFENYPTEWWHFTLDNEPYPNEYFDFPIE